MLDQGPKRQHPKGDSEACRSPGQERLAAGRVEIGMKGHVRQQVGERTTDAMIDRINNRVRVTPTTSGGGTIIVGLVIAAVLFLALLLAFGTTLFSGTKWAERELELTKVEKPAR